MGNKRVVITDHDFEELDMEKSAVREAGAQLEEFKCHTIEEVVDALRGADAAFVQLAPVTQEAIAAMNPGGAIVRLGVGYDNVDVEACKKHNIALANVPDYGIEEVAVHSLAMLLSLARRLPHMDAAVRSGTWNAVASCGSLPAADDIKLGLYGTGRIAQALAKRVAPLGFSCIGYDPYADAQACAKLGIEMVGIDELWERADAISMHAPLTNETKHAINAAVIERLRPGVVIVNCSRGGLIDTDALAQALHDGKVAGAGLDVFAEEPLPADDPLRSAPNLIMTPHAAWCSSRSIYRLRQLATEEIVRSLRNEPLRCPIT